MTEFGTSLFVALDLIISLDPDLVEIVVLSLRVSLVAVFIASVIGLPLGAAIAIGSFPGRSGVVVVLNAMMGLPPVVIGLAVYLVLSRAGPLGEYGLLYTPTAMTIAQAVLITPIIAALTARLSKIYIVNTASSYSLWESPHSARCPLCWSMRVTVC